MPDCCDDDRVEPAATRPRAETDPVCYCLGETPAAIRAEIAAHGRTRAVQRVRDLIASGLCVCEVRNPRGACCLGELMAVAARLEAEAFDRPPGGVTQAGAARSQR
jgi:hypothetical protein